MNQIQKNLIFFFRNKSNKNLNMNPDIEPSTFQTDPTLETSNLIVEPLLPKSPSPSPSSQPQSPPASHKQNFQANYYVDEHLLSLEQLALKYKTDIDISQPNNSRGLSESSYQEIVSDPDHKKNVLSPPKQLTELEKFLSHLLNLFNVLLVAAGILSFIAYVIGKDQVNIYLGVFLFGIVIFDCVIGYLQERSSNNVMGKFKSMMPPKCKILRNGVEMEIKAEELVLGDLVVIQGGDKIPADLRIISNNGLKVEQSALNGESEPVEVSEKALHDDFLESKNIVFNGCLCLEGSAKGIVIKSGDETFLGIIAQQTAQIKHEETPLQQEVKSFVKLIAVLGTTMGFFVFIIGVIRNPNNSLDLFVNGFIIIIIANVPQGLPATVVSCLTIIARRMANEKVFVKKLECIETLGSATCIASDKTGTLTMNKMTVEHIWFSGTLYSAEDLQTCKREFKNSKAWNIMYKIACLCNKAFFQKSNIDNNFVESIPHVGEIKDSLLCINDGTEKVVAIGHHKRFGDNDKKVKVLGNEYKKSVSSFHKKSVGSFLHDEMKNISLSSDEILSDMRKIQTENFKASMKEKDKRRDLEIVGDASESALLRFCESFKNTDLYKLKYPKIFEVPFNSKNKYQLSIHEVGQKRFLVMKGAPEMIIKKCSHYLSCNKIFEIDEKFKVEFQENYEILGRRGERVLGCAYFDMGEDKTTYSIKENNFPQCDLLFVGLFSLMDPPKEGVSQAITAARNAGIKVFMVTGDHPLTAEAIARKVG